MTREEIKHASKDYINYLLDKQEYHNEKYTEYDIKQALYDALAIANIKYKIDFVFPVDYLSDHISDKESLKRGITPFLISKDGIISYFIQDKDSPIIRDILKYKDDSMRSARLTTSNMADMAKYLFEPMYDEPFHDYFIGENPHSILE